MTPRKTWLCRLDHPTKPARMKGRSILWSWRRLQRLKSMETYCKGPEAGGILSGYGLSPSKSLAPVSAVTTGTSPAPLISSDTSTPALIMSINASPPVPTLCTGISSPHNISVAQPVSPALPESSPFFRFRNMTPLLLSHTSLPLTLLLRQVAD